MPTAATTIWVPNMTTTRPENVPARSVSCIDTSHRARWLLTEPAMRRVIILTTAAPTGRLVSSRAPGLGGA